MNISTTFFRIAVVAMSTVGLTNMAGNDHEDCAKYSRPFFVVVGNIVPSPIGESVTARKILYSSLGYAMSEDAKKQLYLGSQEKKESSKDKRYYVACAHMAGYVVVNGTLRHVADKYAVNEDYVNKKCDEYLPESVAWIVKPVANLAVDFAYDYVTVEILKGIQNGIDKSRNS
jgi:hypothetical protein